MRLSRNEVVGVGATGLLVVIGCTGLEASRLENHPVEVDASPGTEELGLVPKPK
jgi:hypothetical protein